MMVLLFPGLPFASGEAFVYAVTHSMIFEMLLAADSLIIFVADCICLRVCSDEIFAVAVQGF